MDNVSQAEAKCLLANIWQVKGKINLALAGYREAIILAPNYLLAYQKLADLLVKTGDLDTAIEYYERALAIDSKIINLSNYYQYLGAVNSAVKTQVNFGEKIADNSAGKINLQGQISFNSHISGWRFALNSLQPLHHSHGILFDGFLENNFAWQHWRSKQIPRRILAKMLEDGVLERLATSEERGIVPYTQPWVGFFHNPPQMPHWFHYRESPTTILNKEIWQESVSHCLGLFTLSQYHARWLREQTNLPVSALIFPTEIPGKKFNYQKFLANAQKKIVQVGWWLRQLNAIVCLPIPPNNSCNYTKIRLLPRFFEKAGLYLQELSQREIENENLIIDPEYADNTQSVEHICPREYEHLLSENIVFIYLYDASGNNTIVECIIRTTPLLINPLPAVIEYLGADYPLYFNTLEEAAEKALDFSLIWDGHKYLEKLEIRNKLSGKYFLNSLKMSEVYRGLS
jgi:tetratricopeptide (TPR) repeat protein